jgi:membrane dipeptidase
MFRILLIGFGAIVVILLIVLGAVWLFGAQEYDQLMNRVAPDPTAPVPTAEDRALHESLFIADLHADTLKWERDLLERSTWGHVDLPRLVEGNVALQSFTIVTKSPLPYTDARYQGDEACVSGDSIDMAALLAASQGRPAFSTRQRAIYQIERLKDAVERSRQRDEGPQLRLILDVGDLRKLVADRQNGQEVVGAILGIEGGHWVGNAEGDPDVVEADMQQLFELGVRQFAPNHRFDNALSGSGEGCERYGLTAIGKQALKTAERLGMAVDLAHISSQGMADAAQLLTEPFMVSHTGVKHNCEFPCRPARNLSDQQIELVLRSGGVIGIGYWPYAVGATVWHIADAMEHVINVAESLGLEPGRHVAFGSDYDGSVTPFFDISELGILTAVMRHRPQPFDEQTIRNIAGRNVCRLFARVLPGGSEQAAEEICTDARAPVLPSNLPSAL